MASTRATTTAASKIAIKAKASAKAKAFAAKASKAKAPSRVTKPAPPRNSRGYIYVLATLSPPSSSRTISLNVIKEILFSFKRRYRIAKNTSFLLLFRLSEILNKIAKLER